MKVELVCDPQCTLGEGPCWNTFEKKLYFTDISECCIWRCDTRTGETKRFWTGNSKVGGFAFGKSGEMILFAENKVLKLHDDRTIETLFQMDFRPGQIFNDIVVDPVGRIFAGTVMHPKGRDVLLRFEKGKSPVIVADDLQCSNGMAFSMDEKTLFHTDTRNCRILKYDYNKETGEMSNRKVFFQGDISMGLPDGMTIDTEDCIWSAFWDGSAIRRFSPSGRIIDHIPTPCKRPTSVAFGGHNLDELYITSANSRQDAKGIASGGAVYRISTQSSGRPEWFASI